MVLQWLLLSKKLLEFGRRTLRQQIPRWQFDRILELASFSGSLRLLGLSASFTAPMCLFCLALVPLVFCLIL
ncbi:hypothetical protein RchiOBHm_Chr3g0486271 [Rosa chinensis]|uniref:Uncharacterized protein n=1 Tax=Rosa chinensis TaxID=74649 RepID=A0A2P6RF69_ROSCH|nr:hypothetical protein RchiOBHm_Chr3g0486271 [Rosa chinensis]